MRKQISQYQLSLSCPASTSSDCLSISASLAHHPEHCADFLKMLSWQLYQKITASPSILNLPLNAQLMLFWFITFSFLWHLFFGLSDLASILQPLSAYQPIEITHAFFSVDSYTPFVSTQHVTGDGVKCMHDVCRDDILSYEYVRHTLNPLKVFHSCMKKEDCEKWHVYSTMMVPLKCCASSKHISES